MYNKKERGCVLMNVASVAAMSIDKATSQLEQQVSITMLKKAMDMQETQSASLVNMMNNQPSFGHTLDIRA